MYQCKNYFLQKAEFIWKTLVPSLLHYYFTALIYNICEWNLCVELAKKSLDYSQSNIIKQ